MEGKSITYNRAKIWQIALFAMNNTATNVFMFAVGYISYYAGNIGGIAVVLISTLLTAMRIFDGFTDPVIGFLIDKTNTKFGKFRPAMVIGYGIMSVTTFILYTTLHKIPEAYRLIYFVAIYAIYIIGYTFQTACTKAGQACLTNDPKQRPTFTMFDGIFNTVVFALLPVWVFSYLAPKYTVGDLYGLNNPELYRELIISAIIAAGILTTLAVIGIAKKDRIEFFGLGTKSVKVEFKDYFEVIKNNRAIQMLIFAASTDKLAGSTMRNASVMIIVFGILTGNQALQGQISLYTSVPTVIILILGVMFAAKMGQKKALVVATICSIILGCAIGIAILFGPMNTMSLEQINLFTIGFLTLYILMGGIAGVSGNIVIPMIADCSDYETYRSGRYIPGMMGTLFSFVDKIVSSFGVTVVGVALASIGYKDSFPVFGDPATKELMFAGVFLFVGMPIIGWICSLIAMKFYPLNKEKMNEIQVEIAKIKAGEVKEII